MLLLFISLPVCFTPIIIFILFYQCSFLFFHLVQVTSQPSECEYTSEWSWPWLLLLLHKHVGHEAFFFHCHAASNLLNRSLVTSKVPHNCFHIANVGCTFPLQHLILCISHLGYRCTTHLFAHPSVAQWILATPPNSVLHCIWVQH